MSTYKGGPFAGLPISDPLRAASEPRATLQRFDLDDLAPFTREGSFSPGSSIDYRSFYVGRDQVHDVLKYLLGRASMSLKLNMFGYDDDELNGIIQGLVETPHVYVQGTLDKSQSGGVHEKKILETWTPAMRSSFAIGQSSTHQISHTKGGVIDGVVAFEGSTNWSASGEGVGLRVGQDLHEHYEQQPTGFKAQNNTLIVHVNPIEILKFSTRLDEEHAVALQQQSAAAAKAASAG